MNTPEAFTVFNWVVPIAFAAIAAHRSRICWDDFNDDDEYEPDPIHDLALDWEPPLHSQPRTETELAERAKRGDASRRPVRLGTASDLLCD